jgi:hypothetical protein
MSYDRDHTPSPGAGLRLLPWESETGKPCFLTRGEPDSVLSRFADAIEATQLRDAAKVLKGARAVLADDVAGELAVRKALQTLMYSVGDVLRIADSRGARLPDPDEDGDGEGQEADGGEGPQLPAEAFG